MRLQILPAAAALATAMLVHPAEAASARLYRHYPPSLHGAYAPYWQSEPTDHRPIWQHGYGEGNYSEERIRERLMRDPPDDR